MGAADDSSETTDASVHERSALAETSVKTVDAGPAPVDHIRQARPATIEDAAIDRQAIDAGSVRIVSERMKAEVELDAPLNPLRAGAAVALRARRNEAVQQLAREPDGADGGSAPKRAAE